MLKKGIFILILVLVSSVYALEQDATIDFTGHYFELYRNDVLNMDVGGDKYLLDVKKININYVEIKIANQIVKLSEYYPVRKLNLNNYGNYDLEISLKELNSRSVLLGIKRTTEADTGWIAFEDIPVIEEIEQAEVKQIIVEEEIEDEYIDIDSTLDNAALFEELMYEEDEEINPLTNLTNFSKAYFNKIKAAVVQIPYIGFIAAGIIILSVLILFMEFGLSKVRKVKKNSKEKKEKQKVKKKKVKKKKTAFEKFIDFLLEED